VPVTNGWSFFDSLSSYSAKAGFDYGSPQNSDLDPSAFTLASAATGGPNNTARLTGCGIRHKSLSTHAATGGILEQYVDVQGRDVAQVLDGELANLPRTCATSATFDEVTEGKIHGRDVPWSGGYRTHFFALNGTSSTALWRAVDTDGGSPEAPHSGQSILIRYRPPAVTGGVAGVHRFQTEVVAYFELQQTTTTRPVAVPNHDPGAASIASHHLREHHVGPSARGRVWESDGKLTASHRKSHSMGVVRALAHDVTQVVHAAPKFAAMAAKLGAKLFGI
jgi:hypothetical protein